MVKYEILNSTRILSRNSFIQLVIDRVLECSHYTKTAVKTIVLMYSKWLTQKYMGIFSLQNNAFQGEHESLLFAIG